MTGRPLSGGARDDARTAAENLDDVTTSSAVSNLIDENIAPQSETLSSFLTDLGGLPSCVASSGNTIPCHVWETGPCIRNEIVGSAKVNSDAKLLIKAAESNLKNFEKHVERIVTFASRQSEPLPASLNSPSICSSPLSPLNASRVSYSVGVKSEGSVIDKAGRKYEGDIFRVKDCLRAQVVLPNESTLVCAMLSLQYICSDKARISTGKRMKIIRIKNLFRLSPLGVIVPTDLPTGYRHILVNVRLSDGLVAEIQFQLEKMYKVLGEDGYRLHRHITEIEKARSNALIVGSNQGTKKRDSSNEANPLLLCRCAETNGVSDLNGSIETVVKSLGIPKSNPQDEGASYGPKYRPYLEQVLEKGPVSKNSILRCHVPLPNGKFTFLEKLSPELHRLTSLDIINAIISSGLSYLQLNAGDASAYICLHKIFSAKQSLTASVADRTQAVLLLMQGVSAVDHAAAGYSSSLHSNMLSPSLDTSVEILEALAAFHGAHGDWDSASSILQSLMLRSEEHLPLHHPIAIAVTIDLAACYLNCGQEERAIKCSERVMQRLGTYLKEQEEAYFLARRVHLLNRGYENGLDILGTMKAYVAGLCRMKRREMAKIVGPTHPMTLLFHSCLGDALSVLANCVGLSKHSDSSLCVCCRTPFEAKLVSVASRTSFVWEVAAIHYRTALRGWISSSGAFNANVPSTAASLARCLRELGRREEALKVLSLAIKAAKEDITPSTDEAKSLCRNGSDNDAISGRSRPEWLPRGSHQTDSGKKEFLAMLMWLMAVYAVEQDHGEAGRMRATTLLRAISKIGRQDSKKAQSESVAMSKLHSLAQAELENMADLAPYLDDEERQNPFDQRAAMLAAMTEGDDEETCSNDSTEVVTTQSKSPDNEPVDSAKPTDPRAAMLSAIKSRQRPSDENEDKPVEAAAPLDPRAAMLSAIKSRQPSNDDEPVEAAAPSDPRAAMLSAIKSRQPPKDDDEPAEAAAPLDPRAAMLSAIKSRQPSSDNGSVEAAAPSDPRAAMLSAIKSRQPPKDENEDKPAEAAAPLDPRAAMLSAIKSRQPPKDDDEPVEAAAPSDPRAAMLSAIKSRQPRAIMSQRKLLRHWIRVPPCCRQSSRGNRRSMMSQGSCCTIGSACRHAIGNQVEATT